MTNRRSLFKAIMVLPMVWAGPSLSHALPDTVITIRDYGRDLEMNVMVPMAELLLALPTSARLTGADVIIKERRLLDDYFRDHLFVLPNGEAPLRFTIRSVESTTVQDEHVGRFELLTLTIIFPRRTSFMLRYDAVMHHIPNHRTEVRWLRSNGDTEALGVIYYDLVTREAAPLLVIPR